MLPEIEHIELHGHRVAFRRAGDGPVLVLIHGITGSLDTWDGVIPELAEDFTVIAPDLLGHGLSAKPQGDYSMGAYASGVRDLVGVLGYDRGTILGHSLGGGIAMQFAYQFPERVERMALVSSGGLGRELNLALRAATLPGAELVLPVLGSDWLSNTASAVSGYFGRLGWEPGPDLAEVARGIGSFHDAEARRAFLNTVRSAINLGGQRIDARDRLYLAAGLPTQIIWGDRDRIMPVEHAYGAHDAIPGSRLEIFEGAGHFPYLSDPSRFVRCIRDFMNETEPGQMSDDLLRGLARQGPATRGSATSSS